MDPNEEREGKTNYRETCVVCVCVCWGQMFQQGCDLAMILVSANVWELRLVQATVVWRERESNRCAGKCEFIYASVHDGGGAPCWRQALIVPHLLCGK